MLVYHEFLNKFTVHRTKKLSQIFPRTMHYCSSGKAVHLQPTWFDCLHMERAFANVHLKSFNIPECKPWQLVPIQLNHNIISVQLSGAQQDSVAADIRDEGEQPVLRPAPDGEV